MNVLTAEQMKNVDRMSIDSFGIPEIILMENAGLCCLEVLKKEHSKNTAITVVCGKGNNAGDGFVLARYLKMSGYNVLVCVLTDEKNLSVSALMNYLIFKKQYPELLFHVKNENEINDVLKDCSLIVDAIFGTGLSSSITNFFAVAIDVINKSGKKVLSIDIPSGINSDSGEIMGCAVKAALTVTIGALKQGLLLYPGSDLAGKIYIADIGFPKKLLDFNNFQAHATLFDDIYPLLVKKNKYAHKYSSGRLLIISGSKDYTGAPCLCANSALNAGCGMVYLAVPQEIHSIIATKVNEAVVIPYNLNFDGDIPSKIIDLLTKIDAIVIGPGLSKDVPVMLFAEKIVKSTDVPLIIDADALQTDILENSKNIIITPHPGEMARIFDIRASEIDKNRLLYAKKASKKFKAVTVLKGADSIITNPLGDTYFNTSGNSAMASAGMGDVLGGIIGTLVAKKIPTFESAYAGVFIHGLAGDIAALYSSYGVTAGEVIKRIPEVLDLIYKKDMNFVENMQKIKTISIY